MVTENASSGMKSRLYLFPSYICVSWENMADAESRRIFPIRRSLPPELLCQVMEYLNDDARSLLSAILVNKSWVAEGISVPWQKTSYNSLILNSKWPPFIVRTTDP